MAGLSPGKRLWSTGNPFGILSDLPDSRTSDLEFPAISAKRQMRPINTKSFWSDSNITECPKYILIKHVEGKRMDEINIFKLKNAIYAISKQIKTANFTRDGNMIVLVKNELIAKAFLKTKKLIDDLGAVDITFHPSLNYNKGLVYAPCISNLTEDEIVDGLKEYKVVKCEKIKKMINGCVTNTPLHILHFDLYHVPKYIPIGFEKFEIREYIPNPLQCKKCFRFGHTKNKCRSNDSHCCVCNLPEHQDTCKSVNCINCKGKHPSSLIECPVYKKKQTVIQIKVENKFTIAEANDFYEKNHSHTHYDSPTLTVRDASILKSAKKKTVNYLRTLRINEQTPHNSPIPILKTLSENNKNTTEESLSERSKEKEIHIENEQNNTAESLIFNTNNLNTNIHCEEIFTNNLSEAQQQLSQPIERMLE